MSKSRVLLVCCLFFIFGIAIFSYCQLEIFYNDLLWFSLIVVSLVILILFWQTTKVRLAALCGLFLFFGIWRGSIGLPTASPDKIWHYNNQQVAVIGVITDEPERRATNQKLTVKARQIEVKDKEVNHEISGKILVTTNLYPKYDYGDEIKLTGELKMPEEFSGFAYDRYLARYDIYSVCYYPEIIKLSKRQGSWLYEKIFYFKNKLAKKVDLSLPLPESGLIKAMILGDKTDLSDELKNNFSQAGLSHIVAISGMHISILAALFMGLLSVCGLSRKKAVWLAGIFLIFYITLIGLPASAMRAGLMGFLVLWALNLGRLNKIGHTIVLTASILLLLNPRLLRDDIGFQLSFLAVLGIVYVCPILNEFWGKIKIPQLRGMRDIFSTTLAAQVFTLPIIAYNFSTVSMVAPLANLLVLWSLPFLMVISLLAIGLSFIVPGWSLPFFLPAYLLSKYIILVAEWTVKLPGACLEIDYLWPGWIVIYYAVVVWGVVKLRNKNTH